MDAVKLFNPFSTDELAEDSDNADKDLFVRAVTVD